jgi:hypothetical protein
VEIRFKIFYFNERQPNPPSSWKVS